MPTKSKLVYLSPAQHDFEEIVKYHAVEAGVSYARKIYKTMRESIGRLRDFSLMGQIHPDPILAVNGFRKLVLTQTYVAVYKHIDKPSLSTPLSTAGRIIPACRNNGNSFLPMSI